MKKIWNKNMDESVHSQFIRFSKGEFYGRAALKLQKSSKIKLGGSFEWANDFAILVSELDPNAKFSGIIFTKKEVPDLIGKQKSGIYKYEVEDISSDKIQEIKDNAYSMLLDCDSEEIKLKMKKRLPKPGKSKNAKVDNKFCQIETDLKYWPQIRDAFMFPECKKCLIKHIIYVEDIIIPPVVSGEKDFAKVRELAKRKGKIIREMEVDKQEKQDEIEFEA